MQEAKEAIFAVEDTQTHLALKALYERMEKEVRELRQTVDLLRDHIDRLDKSQDLMASDLSEARKLRRFWGK